MCPFSNILFLGSKETNTIIEIEWLNCVNFFQSRYMYVVEATFLKEGILQPSIRYILPTQLLKGMNTMHKRIDPNLVNLLKIIKLVLTEISLNSESTQGGANQILFKVRIFWTLDRSYLFCSKDAKFKFKFLWSYLTISTRVEKTEFTCIASK